MGVTVTLRGGSGDMLKSDYDPNLDGVIAKAEIDPTIHGDMEKSTYDSDVDGKIASPEMEKLSIHAGEVLDKIVSANLRNSHDALVTETGSAAYAKKKTITLTNGVKGALRIKFDLYSSVSNANDVYAFLTKNGVVPGGGSDLGAEQTQSDTTPVTKTQDINVGTLHDGQTIDLWLKASGFGEDAKAENLRLYYDNDNDPIVVASTNS